MSKKISQREARQTRKALTELQQKTARMFESFRSEWPGVNIGWQSLTADTTLVRIKTARSLGFAVIVVPQDDGKLCFYAGKP